MLIPDIAILHVFDIYFNLLVDCYLFTLSLLLFCITTSLWIMFLKIMLLKIKMRGIHIEILNKELY